MMTGSDHGTTVAIIGAGVSGLAAIKCCLEEGLHPVCFELFDDIGGPWYQRKDENQLKFQTTDQLIFSKEMYAYSDLMYPQDTPTCLNNITVFQYLRHYCDTFSLWRHIRLQTKIKEIRKSRDYDEFGRWDVDFETSDAETCMETFDFVMICAGFLKNAQIPDIYGIESFPGRIEHSKTFKNGSFYEGQRVVVIGKSTYAGDIASEISKYAEMVYLSVGKGTWILPRVTDGGCPMDQIIYRRSKDVDKILAKALPVEVSQHKHQFQNKYVVNDDLQLQIQLGKVKVTGSLVRMREGEAEFDDGTTVNVDVIVFSTGHTVGIDMLKEDIMKDQDGRDLYQMMYPPSLTHATLTLIGCMVPDGPKPPLVELQCRLAARVFSGKHVLPDKDAMLKDISKWNSLAPRKSDCHRYKLLHVKFRDELASELRVLPSWWDLVKAGPTLTYKYYCGPAFPYHYRLWGPHPWTGARKCIDNATMVNGNVDIGVMTSVVKYMSLCVLVVLSFIFVLVAVCTI